MAKLIDISQIYIQIKCCMDFFGYHYFYFRFINTMGWLEEEGKIFLESGQMVLNCKLDSSGAASLKDGELKWSAFEAEHLKEKIVPIKNLN